MGDVAEDAAGAAVISKIATFFDSVQSSFASTVQPMPEHS